MLILQAIQQFSLTTPNQIALKGAHSVISYAQLNAAIEAIKGKIAAVKPNVIGVAMDNSPAWALLDLASMALGIPTVPLPLFFSPEQMAHAIENAGIDVLVTDKPIQIEGLIHQQNLQIIEKNNLLVDEKILTFFSIKTQKKPQDTPIKTAKITYTSGTTGTPKGVCLSLNTMQTVANSLLKATEAKPTDQHLSILPLSTLLENLAGLYVPLLAGATAIILPLEDVGLTGSSGFQLQKMLHAISTQQPTSLILTPELLLALVSALEAGFPMPTALRFIAVGGASVSPSLLKRADALGLPVFEGYGLSECASVVALNTPQARKIGSVGKPLAHVQININETQEIVVRGAHFLGYLGLHDEQSAQPHTELATGDIGYLDEDGFLHITGRKKNIFITSFGRNVSPEWVERELTSMPAIHQAALFGEALPRNTAVIFSHAQISDADIQSAIFKVNETLPDYARVTYWVRAQQPFSLKNGMLTANGRLRRDAIWQQYQNEINHFYKEQTHAVL